MFDPAQLQPGDCLLYRPVGLIGWLIAIKTGSLVSHCEVFDGLDAEGRAWSLASRDGIGVGRYPFRAEQLTAVHRVAVPFDYAAARDWFWREANGQGYDWAGLLNFFWAKHQGRENGKMFCSEFLARLVREGIWAAFIQRNVVGDAWRGQPVNRKVMVALRLDPWGGRDADAISPVKVQETSVIPKVEELH